MQGPSSSEITAFRTRRDANRTTMLVVYPRGIPCAIEMSCLLISKHIGDPDKGLKRFVLFPGWSARKNAWK